MQNYLQAFVIVTFNFFEILLSNSKDPKFLTANLIFI